MQATTISGLFCFQPQSALYQGRDPSISLNPTPSDVFVRTQQKRILFEGMSRKDKDETLIWDTVFQCQYRKPLEQMLRADSPFKVSIRGDKAILQGDSYYLPEKGQFMGVCNELSYFAMKALEHKLGERYEFAEVAGSCDWYFRTGTHVYLIGRRRRPRWFPSLAEEIRKNLQSGKQELPPHCLLIDPSFKSVGSTEQKQGVYRLTELVSESVLNENKSAENICREEPFQDGGTAGWPLGFLVELLEPRYSLDPDDSRLKIDGQILPDDTLVYWGLRQTGRGQYDVALAIQKDPYRYPEDLHHAFEILQAQAPRSPLFRFVNKVRMQLGHPDAL